MSTPAAIPFPTPADERVVIYCMTCGRSTTAASFVIAGLFGYVPYGLLTGRLHCRKGCGDRFGVILPVDAPNPRLFVSKYGRPPLPPVPDKADRPAPKLNELRGSLVEVDRNGTFVHTHALADEPEILHFGFDFLLKKMTTAWEKPPRLVVTRGAQWSRDSERDWEVIEGDGDAPIPLSQHRDGPVMDASHLFRGGNHRASKPVDDTQDESDR